MRVRCGQIVRAIALAGLAMASGCGPTSRNVTDGRLDAWSLPAAEPPVIPSLMFDSFAYGSDGRLWMAGDDNRLFYTRPPAKLWQNVPIGAASAASAIGAANADSSAVRSVMTDPSDSTGKVWFVAGATVGVLDEGRVTLMRKEQGVSPTCRFEPLSITAAGTIRSSGVNDEAAIEYDPSSGRFIPLQAARPPRSTKGDWPGLRATTLAADRSTWSIAADGLYRLAPGESVPALVEKLTPEQMKYPWPSVPLMGTRSGDVWLLVPDDDGTAETKRLELRVYGVLGERKTRTSIQVSGQWRNLVEDDHGWVWLLTDHGVLRVDLATGASEAMLPGEPEIALVARPAYQRLAMFTIESGNSQDSMLFDFRTHHWVRLPNFGGLPGNELAGFELLDNGGRIQIRAFASRAWSPYPSSTCTQRTNALSWNLDAAGWRRDPIGSDSGGIGPSGTIWRNIQWPSARIVGTRADGTRLQWLPLASSVRQSRFELNGSIILEDHAGDVWVGSGNGSLQACRMGRPNCESFLSQPTIASTEFARLAPAQLVEDRENRLWFLARGRLVQIDKDRHPASSDVRSPTELVTAIGLDSLGQLWQARDRDVLVQRGAEATYALQAKMKVTFIKADARGAIWLGNGDSEMLRLESATDRTGQIVRLPQSASRQSDFDDYSERPRFDVDHQGSVWYLESANIVQQQWRADGLPKRPVMHYLSSNYPRLVALTSGQHGEIVWRLRRTGLIRTEGSTTTAFPYPDAARPVVALEPASNGGVWLGQTGYGISYFDGTHPSQRIEGLPDVNVRGIAAVPESRESLAWVATDGGAARITPQGVQVFVPEASGPVDHVAALADGGAWMVLNPIDRTIDLSHERRTRFGSGEPPDPRAAPWLVRLDANGKRIYQVTLHVGQVLTITASDDGKTVWLGTDRGLFRMNKDGQSELVTANGRLDESPVPIVSADPAGTVWLGISGAGDKPAMRLIGYRPQIDDIDALTTRRGFPAVPRIDSLVFGRDGDLVLSAGDLLLKGPVFVPSRGLTWQWLVGGTVLLLLTGVVLNQTWRVHRYRQREAAAYAPLEALCRIFFTSGSGSLRKIDPANLNLTQSGKRIPVHLALGRLLAVEDVMKAFATVAVQKTERKSDDMLEAYLVYPVEMDPAARRQLDVYRVKEHVALIPIPAPFMRAKLQEGADAARIGLDVLRRRYLSEQDLFDMKNAIDEARFFFGRRVLLDDVQRALTRGEHIALLGPRKAGKSSVLNLLAQRLDAFPVVKSDFQLYSREAADWPEKLLAEIVLLFDQWGRSYFGAEHWQPPELAEGPIDGLAFRSALQNRREIQLRLGNTQTLVILLDEIERVFPNSPEPTVLRAEAARFNRAVGILRALGQASGERLLSLVIADVNPQFVRVNAFGISGVETNPFYRFLHERYLTPLSREECAEMLNEIAMAMGLGMQDDLVQQIFEGSGGHASLARRLASSACQCRQGLSELNSSHYVAGLKTLADTGELDMYFAQNYWSQATTAERWVLQMCGGEEGVEPGQLEGVGSTASAASRLDARRMLSSTGVVEHYRGERLRVAGALFREWLRESDRQDALDA